MFSNWRGGGRCNVFLESRKNHSVDINLDDMSLSVKGKSKVAKATLAHIAGYVAKKLLSRFGNCEKCRRLLLSSDGDVPV